MPSSLAARADVRFSLGSVWNWVCGLQVHTYFCQYVYDALFEIVTANSNRNCTVSSYAQMCINEQRMELLGEE
jgi:hypothetical protein